MLPTVFSSPSSSSSAVISGRESSSPNCVDTKHISSDGSKCLANSCCPAITKLASLQAAQDFTHDMLVSVPDSLPKGNAYGINMLGPTAYSALSNKLSVLCTGRTKLRAQRLASDPSIHAVLPIFLTKLNEKQKKNVHTSPYLQCHAQDVQYFQHEDC